MDSDESDYYNHIEEVFCTPEIKEEIEMEANASTSSITSLPEKSKHRYESMYESYEKWAEHNKIVPISFSEDTLFMFFRELSAKKSPSTLWCTYSMLKSMIKLKHDIDIGNYAQLLSYLKDQSKGYTAVTAPVFTDAEVNKFITEAPDEKYLSTKVALIFGLLGAYRADDLTGVRVQNIETHGRIFLVKIPKSDQKSTIIRSFTITDQYFDIVDKYRKLRPRNVKYDRFFLSVRNGKCTGQPIGRNKFASMPREIANYLELENAHLYTGHSMRKTSNFLSNSGTDRRTIKKHSIWKSTTEVQEYIEDNSHYEEKPETFVKSSVEPDEDDSLSLNNSNSNDSDIVLPDVSINSNSTPTITCTTSLIKNKNDIVLDLPMSMLYEEDNDVSNQKPSDSNSNRSLNDKRLDLIKKHFIFNNCSNVYINFK